MNNLLKKEVELSNKKFALEKGTYTLGSSPSCNIDIKPDFFDNKSVIKIIVNAKGKVFVECLEEEYPAQIESIVITNNGAKSEFSAGKTLLFIGTPYELAYVSRGEGGKSYFIFNERQDVFHSKLHEFKGGNIPIEGQEVVSKLSVVNNEPEATSESLEEVSKQVLGKKCEKLQLSKEVEELKRERNDNEEFIRSHSKDVDDKIAEILELTQKSKDLEVSFEELEARVNLTKIDLENLVNEKKIIDEDNRLLRIQKNDLLLNSERFKKSILELNEELNTKNSRLESASLEASAIEEKIGNIEEGLYEKGVELSELEQVLIQKRDGTARLSSLFDETRIKVDRISEELCEKEQLKKLLDDKVALREREFQSLKIETQKMRDSFKFKQEKYQSEFLSKKLVLDNRISLCEEKLKDISATIEESELCLTKLKSDQVTLGEDNSRLVSENSLLEVDISNREKLLTSLEESVKFIQGEVKRNSYLHDEKKKFFNQEERDLKQGLEKLRIETLNELKEQKTNADKECKEIVAKANKEASEARKKVDLEVKEKERRIDEYSLRKESEIRIYKIEIEEKSERIEKAAELRRIDSVAILDNAHSLLSIKRDEAATIIKKAQEEAASVLKGAQGEASSVLRNAQEEASSILKSAQEDADELAQESLLKSNQVQAENDAVTRAFQAEISTEKLKLKSYISFRKEKNKNHLKIITEEHRLRLEGLEEAEVFKLEKEKRKVLKKIICFKQEVESQLRLKKQEQRKELRVLKKQELEELVGVKNKLQHQVLDLKSGHSTQLEELLVEQKLKFEKLQESEIRKNGEMRRSHESSLAIAVEGKIREVEECNIRRVDSAAQEIYDLFLECFSDKLSEREILKSKFENVIKDSLSNRFKSDESDALGERLSKDNRKGFEELASRHGLKASIVCLLISFIVGDLFGVRTRFISSTGGLVKEHVKKTDEMKNQELININGERLFDPKMDYTYKGSYTENVLYTKNYFENYQNESFQNEWTLSLYEYVVEELELSEEFAVNFISSEGTLITELVEMRKGIDARFLNLSVDKMNKREKEFIDKFQKEAGSSENWMKIKEFTEMHFQNNRASK